MVRVDAIMKAGPAKRQNGAAAIEFAAVFMIFFAVFYGLVSYTLPMLMLLSFGAATFAQSHQAPVFFKTAGVVVVGLGVFAFLAGLAGLGLITPLFSV